MQAGPTERLINLFQEETNLKCLHCGKPSKQWAELSFAIFLCLDCAAAFREFNWIVKIKSVNLDDWSPEEVDRMERGGNQSFSNFLQQYGLQLADIRLKVSSKASKYYKDMLDGKALGAQPSIEDGRLVDKKEMPLTDMKADEVFQSAKEKAFWLGGKTKQLGQKGIKKVQDKWESGEIKDGAKNIANGVSTRAKWLWGVVKGKVNELRDKKEEPQENNQGEN